MPEVIGVVLVLLIVVGFMNSSIPQLATNVFRGTPTPTPLPSSLPVPEAGTIYIKLPAEDLTKLDSFENETLSSGNVPGRMVVVAKHTTTSESDDTVTEFFSEEFCVSLAAMLDEFDIALDKYDPKKTENVMVILAVDDLARYSEAIQEKIQIYLVPDPTCSDPQ